MIKMTLTLAAGLAVGLALGTVAYIGTRNYRRRWIPALRAKIESLDLDGAWDVWDEEGWMEVKR